MITHVKLVSIPTRDQQRALQFYTGQLGFAIATDQPYDDSQRWIELRIGSSPTRFVLFTPHGHEERIGSFLNATLACDDVEATCRQLRQRGVEVSDPVRESWGSYAMLTDPDGNQILLGSG
jgi:predicted enzyme related to lactoylglutathione lyase